MSSPFNPVNMFKNTQKQSQPFVLSHLTAQRSQGDKVQDKPFPQDDLKNQKNKETSQKVKNNPFTTNSITSNEQKVNLFANSQPNSLFKTENADKPKNPTNILFDNSGSSLFGNTNNTLFGNTTNMTSSNNIFSNSTAKLNEDIFGKKNDSSSKDNKPLISNQSNFSLAGAKVSTPSSGSKDTISQGNQFKLTNKEDMTKQKQIKDENKSNIASKSISPSQLFNPTGTTHIFNELPKSTLFGNIQSNTLFPKSQTIKPNFLTNNPQSNSTFSNLAPSTNNIFNTNPQPKQQQQRQKSQDSKPLNKNDPQQKQPKQQNQSLKKQLTNQQQVNIKDSNIQPIQNLDLKELKQEKQVQNNKVQGQKSENEKILDDKKQQIMNIINLIEKNEGKIQLKSKLAQLELLQQQSLKLLNQNCQKKKHEVELQFQKLTQSLEQNRSQIRNLEKQNLNLNHFQQILSKTSEKNQVENYPDKDSIDNQMSTFIQELNRYYKQQNNNSSSQTQLKNLWKNIQKQEATFNNINSQNLNINFQNAQTLKKTYSPKTLQFSLDSSVKVSQSLEQIKLKKQESFDNNLSQHKQNDKQKLEKLKKQNARYIQKLSKENQNIKKKKIVSKISEGRTSMIMKSIIME